MSATRARAAPRTRPSSLALPRARREAALWLVLVGVALVLRLIELGERPFHHDESQDAYFSWRLWSAGDYEYDPLLHGPLRFYLTALAFTAFGDSDFTARLAPALVGTALVALAWFLRPLLGRVAAGAAGLLLAVGPSFLYFSRFAREDVYVACLTLALLVLAFAFLRDPRPWQPPAVGVLLAASFATKETTFITAFVFGTFLIAWFLRDLASGRRDLAGRLAAPGRRPWLWALAAFLLTQLVLLTTFGTDLDHWDGLWEGLAYWLGQHDVGRGGEAWFFYAVVLAMVEWPALLLGLAGAVAALRRPDPLRLFLIWGFAVSLAVYSWAGEKFAWLVLHPLLPLVLLAGLGVQQLWALRGRLRRAAGLSAATVALAYVVASSWSVNADSRTDPRELLVSTQTSEQVLDVRDEILALAAERPAGEPLRVAVDSSDGAAFPWAWYLRELPGVSYADFSDPSAAAPAAELALLTDPSRDRLEPRMRGWTAVRFPFRVWWARDYERLSPASALKWIVTREPWSATGSMPEWLLARP